MKLISNNKVETFTIEHKGKEFIVEVGEETTESFDENHKALSGDLADKLESFVWDNCL